MRCIEIQMRSPYLCKVMWIEETYCPPLEVQFFGGFWASYIEHLDFKTVPFKKSLPKKLYSSAPLKRISCCRLSAFFR